MSQLDVLYEDNHLLCVRKPAGIPTQGDISGDHSLLDMGKDYLRQKYAKPGNVYLGLVHRLDRPTEGIVLFARTSKAASRLSEQFREGSIEKLYLALLCGQLPEERGVLEHYLCPGPQNKTRIAKGPGGDAQKARLSFQRLDRSHPAFPDTTFVEVKLETGRKHQIRAQFSAIGYPVVGDRKYGARTPLKAGRIALVAHAVTFQHPVREEKIVLRLELSPSWPKGLSGTSKNAA